MSETLHIQMMFVLKYLFFILLAVCVCVRLGLEPGFEVDSTLECSKRF